MVRYVWARKKLVFFLSFFSLSALSQSVEQIKADKSYMSGEGWGYTLKQADDAALQDLISKISVTVQGAFHSSEEEILRNGKVDSKTAYRSIVNTYTQATLTNTQRIVIENEPDAHVLRYVKTAEVKRIFEGRKSKVLDMVESAERAERRGKIDDALRYYYWAFCLLKSLQYSNELRYTCSDGRSRLLVTWIPEQMNQIFAGISVSMGAQNGHEVQLSIQYRGKSVSSLDYTYFDGMDWSNIYSAKDGKGVIDLRPGQPTDHLRIKCEYEFAGESHIDKEVETVMELYGSTAFKNAYITLSNDQQSAIVAPVTSKVSTSNIAHTNNVTLATSIEQIYKAIGNKHYADVSHLFTGKGWSQFQKLIHYGQASIMNNADLQFSTLGDKVMCRGTVMSFSFKNNNRKFVEDVVFTFNKKNKIEGVAFGLGNDAYNDIMLKGVWAEDARKILVNFLEEYKTAYALKDLEFVRNVFDDNAVIITGRVTHKPQNIQENSPYLDSNVVKFTKQSKDEYLRNLAHCFAGNEFINIRFANNDVVKSGKGGETYGIQIKQDYYSSTYGDTGYLFLMIDINNPDKPIIKVRTWQPERDPDFGIIGVSDF